MKVTEATLRRRQFLLSVGAGAAAAAAGLAVKSGSPGTPSQASADKRSSQAGYRETAHVRNYYRTAQV